MTAQNLYQLAESGQLGQSLAFEGYCISAAIDACFNTQDVPAEVYKANHAAFASGEIGQEGEATDRLYRTIGSLVFKHSSPDEFAAVDYYFTNFEEFRADVAELRGNATILLDVEDGSHSVGLKPAGDNPDEWQIVGTHQIVAVASKGNPLDVQCMIEPKTITTKKAWKYLLANNTPGVERQTALVFPPEPTST